MRRRSHGTTPKSSRYRVETRIHGLPWTSRGISQALGGPNDFSTASAAGGAIAHLRSLSATGEGDELWGVAEYRVVQIGRR